jgi:hypothetical protein
MKSKQPNSGNDCDLEKTTDSACDGMNLDELLIMADGLERMALRVRLKAKRLKSARRPLIILNNVAVHEHCLN